MTTDHGRLATILELILELARGEYSRRLDASPAQDEIDAITTGINMLAEDLAAQQHRRSKAAELRDDTVDLYENAPAMFASVDAADGRIVKCNDTLARTLDYNKEELLGHPLLTLYEASSQPRATDAFNEFLSQGTAEHEALKIRKKSGQLIDATLRMSAVRNDRGEILRARCVLQDVGQALRIQAQFQQNQRLEALGRLTGGIAHEFNNLLTAIQGAAHFLHEAVAADSTSAQDLADLVRAASQAGELAGQLLAFSRHQLLDPRVINVNELVDRSARMLRRLLRGGIEFRTFTVDDVHPTLADPARLEQILVNLAVNARDAMGDRGTLTIRTRNERAVAGDDAAPPIADPGDYVVLSVSDTGSGIAQDQLERVFDPFFSTKETGQGTGLGLAVCRATIQQHGGHILVHSVLGEGTTFEVYLPRAEGPVHALAERARPSGPTGSETILVVEDEASVRSLAVRALRDHGYKVMEASDGEIAERILGQRRGEVDLVLTDIVMPVVGGLELHRRAVAAGAGARFLFMSGYSDEPLDAEFDGGRVAFVQKPFVPAALLDKIRTVLDAPR